jgi:hypothetical protein
MEFVAIAGHLPEADELRGRVKSALSSQYVGWSDNYDRQFDSHATWFGLRRGQEFLATCKLIFKRHEGQLRQLPMESGDLRAFTLPDTIGVCEGSGLSLMGSRYILALLCGMGRWMTKHGIGYVYSIVDTRNRKLQLLYRKLGFEFLPDQIVSFSGFRHKEDGQPVLWQVIRMSPEIFQLERNYANLGRLGCSGYCGCSCNDGAIAVTRLRTTRQGVSRPSPA